MITALLVQFLISCSFMSGICTWYGESISLPEEGLFPKVPVNDGGPMMLQAFYLPPFNTPDQEQLNLLCPVRALDAYVHRAALWCNFEQLFVCLGHSREGALHLNR